MYVHADNSSKFVWIVGVMCLIVLTIRVLFVPKRYLNPENEAPEKTTEFGFFFGLVCGVMTAVISWSKFVWIVDVMCMFVLTI